MVFAGLGLFFAAFGQLVAVLAGVACIIAGFYIIASAGLGKDGTATIERWKELASRFQALPSSVRAEWYSEGLDWNGQLHGEFWLFRNDPNKTAEALCQLAGVTLRQSKALAPKLSEKVRTRSDDGSRWLYYVKENHALANTTTGTAHSYGTKVSTSAGDIEHFGEVSANICLRCAADEIATTGA
ncbi:MAG: hypothetical protein ACRD2M_03515 [Terriglobales bacterium]